MDQKWCCFVMCVQCDFTKFDLICVEFLDSVSEKFYYFFYSAAIDIETEISLEIETLYNSWSNATDPKEKVNSRREKRSLTGLTQNQGILDK